MIYDTDNTRDKFPVKVIADGVEINKVVSVDIDNGIITHYVVDEVGCMAFGEGENEFAKNVIVSSNIQMIDKDGNVFAELKK